MKSIAQEFALEVQERLDLSGHVSYGHFDSGQEPMGFHFNLDHGWDGHDKYWFVTIDDIEIYNDMGETVGHYDKKQLAEFIAEANEQLMGCML